MKKILVFTIVLLSGCATEIPVSKRYDVSIPAQKATLAIELHPDSRGINPLETLSVRQIRDKYFIEAVPESADFVLKETSWQNDCSMSGWGYLTMGTLGVIPSWGRQGCVFSYSLTRRGSGKTLLLSDVKGETRAYLGWLMMPAIFFPNMMMDLENTSARAPAMASAIEEAASLVYNPTKDQNDFTPAKQTKPEEGKE